MVVFINRFEECSALHYITVQCSTTSDYFEDDDSLEEDIVEMNIPYQKKLEAEQFEESVWEVDNIDKELDLSDISDSNPPLPSYIQNLCISVNYVFLTL